MQHMKFIDVKLMAKMQIIITLVIFEPSPLGWMRMKFSSSVMAWFLVFQSLALIFPSSPSGSGNSTGLTALSDIDDDPLRFLVVDLNE